MFARGVATEKVSRGGENRSTAERSLHHRLGRLPALPDRPQPRCRRRSFLAGEHQEELHGRKVIRKRVYRGLSDVIYRAHNHEADAEVTPIEVIEERLTGVPAAGKNEHASDKESDNPEVKEHL